MIIALALKLRDEIWAQVLEDLVKVKLPDWRDNAWVLGKLADNNLEDHLEENSFLDVKLLIHTFHFPLTLTYTTNSLWIPQIHSPKQYQLFVAIQSLSIIW